MGDLEKAVPAVTGNALIEVLRKRLKTDPDTPQPEVKYRCDQCKDEGGWMEKVSDPMYQVESKPMYAIDRWVICPCKAQEATEKLFASSEITPAMRRMSFERFEPKGRPESVLKAYEKAQMYLWNFQDIKDTRENSIALLGASGSGKTHLLLSVALSLIEEGVQVLYFPFIEAMNELKNEIRTGGSGYKESRLQRAPVLFIDDLFKSETKLRRGPSDFELKFMFAVVNYRYLNNLPMLICSEFDVNQLIGFDEAFGSRIKQMTEHYRVTMKGKDINYRLLVKGE